MSSSAASTPSWSPATVDGAGVGATPPTPRKPDPLTVLDLPHRQHPVRRDERIAARRRPEIPANRMLGHPFEQFDRIKEAIERSQRAHFGLRDAEQDVTGAQLARRGQARRAE